MSWQGSGVAALDIQGFISALKDHAGEHGFHVHDERHLVETYSMRQVFEVDVHPEDACGGPLDLHISLEIDPRVVLEFEDLIIEASTDDIPETLPENDLAFPFQFTWTLPPLPNCPDLLILATDMAGIGGTALPVEVSAIDSFASVTDAAERSLTMVARLSIPLNDIFMATENLCEPLDRCLSVCEYVLDRALYWLNEV